MTKNVAFLSEATEELQNAYSYYRQFGASVADAFLKEIDQGLALIQESPTRWPRYTATTQRFLLRRFPYSIVYLPREQTIYIIAVAHHKRRPGYWKKRNRK